MIKKVIHNVHSSIRPDIAQMTDLEVFVASDIREHDKETDNGLVREYIYTLTIYDKNAYMQELIEKNKVLEDELLTTQMALCDIYEMLGGLE